VANGRPSIERVACVAPVMVQLTWIMVGALQEIGDDGLIANPLRCTFDAVPPDPDEVGGGGSDVDARAGIVVPSAGGGVDELVAPAGADEDPPRLGMEPAAVVVGVLEL
jgi:hypothetical protein